MSRARQTITHLPIEQLTAHPDNVREDLGDLTDIALSIRELGILEPLIVTEHRTRANVYVLLDGHRRLAAGTLVNLVSFPAIIRHHVDDPAEQTITMLATDVHKRAFTPLERAQAYESLRNRGLSGSEIARRVGVSPSVVSYYLNLVLLDEAARERVEAGELPITQAISNVQKARQAERAASGRPRRGRPDDATIWFSHTHRLAGLVREACSHHGERSIVGKSGCGPCWEATIAADALRAALTGQQAAS